jgi:hypothetical protein
MGDSTYYPHGGSNIVDMKEVNVFWTANGASDPAETSITGEKVTSVVHAATGKFTVTLNEGYNRVEACSATIDEDNGSPTASRCVVAPVDATAVPLQFYVWTLNSSSVATDYSSRVVRLSLRLKNSSVGG